MTLLTRIASGLLAVDHKIASLSSRALSAAANLNTKHAEALARKSNAKTAAGEAKARKVAEARKEQAHRQLATQLRGIQEQLQVDLSKVYTERDSAAQAATSYKAVGDHCFIAACIRDERAATLKGLREELRSV